MFARLILISAVADLEAVSQKPSSIDTRPLPPLPGESFTAPQVNVAYGTFSNHNVHSTAYTQYYDTQSVTNHNGREDEIHSDSYEYVSNRSGSAGEASLYMPLSLATRDEGNDYMHLFLASKVKEQTDLTASSKVNPTVSSKDDPSKVNPTLPTDPSELTTKHFAKVQTDSTASPNVNPTVSSKVDPTDSVSSKVNPTLSTDPSELTMEHFADADPRQAQLWMLLQIHKMVQKMERMEDLYESAGYLRPPSPVVQTTTATEQPPPPAIPVHKLRPPSPLPPTADLEQSQLPAISADNLRPPSPLPQSMYTTATEQPPPPAIPADNLRPPSPLLQTATTAEQPQSPAIPADYPWPPSPIPPIATTTEQPHPTTEPDLEYHDASSIVQPTDAEKQQPSPATQVQQKMPTRKEIYINLGGTQKKTTYKPLLPSPPPPAIPPKTYKKISYVQVKESSGPAGSRPRQKQTPSAQQRREPQIIEDYKNVPQQEMIGKTNLSNLCIPLLYCIPLLTHLQTH